MNPVFAAIYGVLAVSAIGFELYGVFSKKRGTTITAGYRVIDRWLSSHSPVADWLYRVVTGGFLVWLILHFLVGTK